MTVLLALACTPAPPPGPASPAAWVPSEGEPVGFELVVASGNQEGVGWVRAVTSLGTSVFAPPVDITVDGETIPVELGPEGYGEFTVEGMGTHAIEVGGMQALIHVYGSDWRGFGLFAGRPAPAMAQQDAVSAGGGVLTTSGNRLWWTGPSGLSHPVLTTPGTIGGVATGNLDGDGVVDAVAWSNDSVYLLRGRREGGLFGVQQLQSDTHTVAGATLGDASNDGQSDLVIAWIGGPEAGRLDVWEGDGLLGFTPTTNRLLTEVPVDVAVGDNRATGQNLITVNLTDGEWRRWYRGPEHYAPAGPSLVLSLPTAGRAYALPDMAGNGSMPLMFAPPHVWDAPRELVIFDLRPDSLEFTNFTRDAAHFTVGDLDEDGLADLLLFDQSGDVGALHANPETDGLRTEALLNMNMHGAPVGILPGGDLLLASEPDWITLRKDGESEGWFEIWNPEWLAPGLEVPGGRFALAELDGDPVPELVAMGEGASPRLQVWDVEPEDTALLGELELEGAFELRDLALCGEDVFVLLADSLHWVDVSMPGQPALVATTPVDADAVACGPGPQGPVALVMGETISLRDEALVEVDTVPASGAVAVWLDEAGAVFCVEDGCEIARGPVGALGVQATVISSPDGAFLDGQPLHGAGGITFADVDANGFLDVLLKDDGRVTVHRHTGDQLGAPEVFRTRLSWVGDVSVGDLDGDGQRDLWGVEAGGQRLRVSPPVARMEEPAAFGP